MTTDLISRKALEDLQEPAYNENHYIIDRIVSINVIRRLPTINAVIIPDNATNGDVIKAIFDVTEVRQLDCCAFIDTSDDANMRTYKDWWNAPYKKKERTNEGT